VCVSCKIFANFQRQIVGPFWLAKINTWQVCRIVQFYTTVLYFPFIPIGIYAFSNHRNTEECDEVYYKKMNTQMHKSHHTLMDFGD